MWRLETAGCPGDGFPAAAISWGFDALSRRTPIHFGTTVQLRPTIQLRPSARVTNRPISDSAVPNPSGS
jgi:hypothetical protein